MSLVLPTIHRLQGYTPQGFAGDLIRESQFVWRYNTQKPASFAKQLSSEWLGGLDSVR